MKASVQFMVVDDDHTSNLICKHTLRRFFTEQYPITIFTEPEDALKAIEKKYIKNSQNDSTILFLDINMPSMSGWEFLDEFKNFGIDIHKQFIIYMLSSSVSDDDKEKAEKNPFVSGFISKPLTLNKLKETFITGDTIE